VNHVLQIVPRLAPAISGMGDYAALLAGELLQTQGWRTRFLVTDVRRLDLKPQETSPLNNWIDRCWSVGRGAGTDRAATDTSVAALRWIWLPKVRLSPMMSVEYESLPMLLLAGYGWHNYFFYIPSRS
jgi:hypothetical protein